MQFLANAGAMLAGRQCLTCDCDIKAHHSAYLDIDGDGASERITIRHAWCEDDRREAAASAAASAFEEAAKIAEHNTTEDVVVACRSRAKQLRRRAAGESGARNVVEVALGLVS